MPAPDALVGFTGLFIVGMIWLRTRMQYSREPGPLRLQRAGWTYFGGVLLLLAAGWTIAPWLGRVLAPETTLTPTLLREIWFLAAYYLFILVHRILRARGVRVFGV